LGSTKPAELKNLEKSTQDEACLGVARGTTQRNTTTPIVGGCTELICVIERCPSDRDGFLFLPNPDSGSPSFAALRNGSILDSRVLSYRLPMNVFFNQTKREKVSPLSRTRTLMAGNEVFLESVSERYPGQPRSAWVRLSFFTYRPTGPGSRGWGASKR